MCRNKFLLFALILALPVTISLTGCSDDDEEGSSPSTTAPVAGATCPVVNTLNFATPISPRFDCASVVANDDYFCVQDITIGDVRGDFSIANPNKRASIDNILFSLDWAQFAEEIQTFKNGDVSCLNPIEPGVAFEDAARDACLTGDGLFEAVSNVIANIASGKISPTVTIGRCADSAI